MYERVVDVPRLLRFYGEDARCPILSWPARDACRAHYAGELGRALPYRRAVPVPRRPGLGRLARRHHRPRTDRGHDGRHRVARFAARLPAPPPRRRRVIRHRLGHGDLIVMGGSCQRTWEHAVPKTNKPVGPRISIQFRPEGRALTTLDQGLSIRVRSSMAVVGVAVVVNERSADTGCPCTPRPCRHVESRSARSGGARGRSAVHDRPLRPDSLSLITATLFSGSGTAYRIRPWTSKPSPLVRRHPPRSTLLARPGPWVDPEQRLRCSSAPRAARGRRG